MSFDSSALGVMSVAGSAGMQFTMYVYHTADGYATIYTPYFNTTDCPNLRIGDVIIFVGGVGGTPTLDLSLITAINTTHSSLANLS